MNYNQITEMQIALDDVEQYRENAKLGNHLLQI